MACRWITIVLLSVAIGGCGTSPEAGHQQIADNGYDNQATGGDYDAENVIPLAIRGLWRPVATESPRAEQGCAGPILRIDDDRLAYPYVDALLESIDQISSDYLRATFTIRSGGRVERHVRTLAVSEDDDRLTIRGIDAAGQKTIERYRRCSPGNSTER
jgi:hypothetical protein